MELSNQFPDENEKTKKAMPIILAILVLTFVVIMYLFIKKGQEEKKQEIAPPIDVQSKVETEKIRPLTEEEIQEAARPATEEEKTGMRPLTAEEIQEAARPATEEEKANAHPLTEEEIQAAAQKAS